MIENVFSQWISPESLMKSFAWSSQESWRTNIPKFPSWQHRPRRSTEESTMDSKWPSRDTRTLWTPANGLWHNNVINEKVLFDWRSILILLSIFLCHHFFCQQKQFSSSVHLELWDKPERFFLFFSTSGFLFPSEGFIFYLATFIQKLCQKTH